MKRGDSLEGGNRLAITPIWVDLQICIIALAKYTKNRLVYVVILVALGMLGCKSTKPARDLDALTSSKGVDLEAALQPICAGNTNALAQVLQLSLNFTSLDGKARAYQKLLFGVYCTLQNMGAYDHFAHVLAAQDPNVQQRVRDLVFDSLIRDQPSFRGSYRESWRSDGHMPDIPTPRNGRFWTDAEIRLNFKAVFPANYEFGHDNPMFAHGA